MIADWTDCCQYMRADFARWPDSKLNVLARQPQMRWQVRLRLTEWWCNSRGGAVGAVLRWRLAANGHKLGYSIAINRLGPGVRIGHVGTVVLNGAATVGSNCQILQGVTLGGNDRGAPSIGDNVFIGPNVCVMGDVNVGDGAVLVAGAVVTKNVPPGETWGGVPAKKISRIF